jgi:hypothetical protein
LSVRWKYFVLASAGLPIPSIAMSLVSYQVLVSIGEVHNVFNFTPICPHPIAPPCP